MTSRSEGSESKELLDALVVGAGFSGLYMLYRLREAGFRVRVFEAGGGVGGTWYWNRYPGARCDIESLEYSYQFSEELQQEWHWPERYSPQSDILDYLNHVADRFDLRKDIQLHTRVRRARFDESTNLWTIETEQGELVRARLFITGVGCLSAANLPEWEGLDRFRGETCHTAAWPEEGVDFTGKRVGVIGTGSSAIQSIPIIAEQAEHLYVFQRTPAYSVPAGNAPLDPTEEHEVKARYAAFRKEAAQTPFGVHWEPGDPCALDATPEERERCYQRYWDRGGLYFLGAFQDLMTEAGSNETASEFLRRKIREIVRDSEVAERLMPSHPMGCKRLCADTGYFETYNRPNVTLVDVSEAPIERFSESGLVTGGREHALDYVVFATGFDAMTGSLLKIEIEGRDGMKLAEKWEAGPITYLGLGVGGFPNYFNLAGPGSPSVLASMVPAIEQHVEWVGDCLEYMRENGLSRIEPGEAAERAWIEHVNDVADQTLFPRCASWYLGANIEGKPRVFMPYIGFPTYVAKCDEVAAKGYEGFEFA